ncbi:MAG: Eco57I restriction-modification methylase domain-containing protein [Bacteroidia bacterium]|nr:Eco57I restriction-modification methylase domain-containing protein [Bacteroidia bacterium]
MNLSFFNTTNLFDAATNLFQQLGIKLNSNTAEPLPVKDLLKQHFKDNDTFKTIGKTYFIGIIYNTVFQATGMFDVNYSYKEALQQGDKNYDGLMLFALELGKHPSRTEISDLTRTFNRISQKMPVALVLKYKTGKEVCFSIAISERFKYKQNWRQGEKAGKVIILRDIHSETTHAGHQRILLDLVKPVGVNYFDQLHQHWLQVLDVNILNKKFFQDLANWYFWAMKNVSFPDDLEKKKEVRNATNLIRLITRVVFIWFIKEKSLVPFELFDSTYLNKILKDFNKNKKSQNYYHAILQNLFFGTLNQKMDERKFAKEGDININQEEYGVKNLFRYTNLFNISEKEAMQLFKNVPFLNGGLFDCLDKPNDAGKIIYVDGFSRNPDKQASVPDYIFFGEEREVDLTEDYDPSAKRPIVKKVKGLVDILESYKFTVAENTPIEEEIALDPELLGKVFENLLASYNPETQTTARKQTGSFYTPREIVNYMVDESLIEYLKQTILSEPIEKLKLGDKQTDMFGNKARKGQLKLEASVKPNRWKVKEDSFEKNLRQLFSYENIQPFTNLLDIKELTEAINNSKILDPACGSGAYPMGILHKMVHLLQKLDPENIHWKALQRQKAIEETEAAFEIGDKEERGKRLAEINDVFENNASDYGRKLYLIENCIYVIDIQPIAVQISKLRFFISLIIDQNKQATKENYGIRSLPNLETKFVAANTLIGLDKPAQTLLRNPKIEENETELKELRHKYFTANTRKEKLQYQKQDKKLRQEIAKMLESDGWQTAVAKQIVAFDPYDQNTFANWFDPEWMFGLTTGFDIVIGNPPYKVESKTDQIKYKSYSTINCGDLYAYFFEKSIKGLIKPNGALSFITASLFIKGLKFESLRVFLEQNIKLIALEVQGDKVFENVQMPTAVLIGTKSNKKTNDWTFENFIPNNDIIKSIESNSKALSQICDVMRGFEIGRDQLTEKGEVKFITGSDVVKWGIKKFSYISKKIENDYKKNEDCFKGERILIREKGSDLTVLYLKAKLYCNRSLYSIKVRDKKYSSKYIAALLNSSLFQFYYQSRFKSETDLFPKIRITQVNQLPIRYTDFQNRIDLIVDYILSLKDDGLDSSFFERLIDAMVYELYLPEEIKAGGAEVLKYLSNLPELKEGPHEKNLKTIEKVYKELSDPGHPISAALLKLLSIEEVNIIEGRKRNELSQEKNEQ